MSPVGEDQVEQLLSQARKAYTNKHAGSGYLRYGIHDVTQGSVYFQFYTDEVRVTVSNLQAQDLVERILGPTKKRDAVNRRFWTIN